MVGWKDRQKDRQKDGQTLFHRTLPANARGPKNRNSYRQNYKYNCNYMSKKVTFTDKSTYIHTAIIKR